MKSTVTEHIDLREPQQLERIAKKGLTGVPEYDYRNMRIDDIDKEMGITGRRKPPFKC